MNTRCKQSAISLFLRLSPGTMWRRVTRALGACATVALLALPASSAQCRLHLGEVTTPNAQGRVNVEFRSIVKKEFARLEQLHGKGSKAYVLSASLLKMETVQRSRATCVVSATIREHRGGSLKAVLRGRASVMEDTSSTRLQAEAMQVAVKNALSRVDQVLESVD